MKEKETRNKEEKEVAYTGISLRREHVENDKLPSIRIFCDGIGIEAEEISYGIEEEGLPFRIRESENPFEDALCDVENKGLGVALGIADGRAELFCRQLKKNEPLMSCTLDSRQRLRILGKNSARIVKNRPLILDD